MTPFGLLLLGSTALMLLALAASLSRSAWIALALSLVAMLLCHGGRRALLLLGPLALVGTLGVLLGAFGWLPPLVASRLTVLLENFTLFDPRAVTLTSENFALVQRMSLWQAAWDMFLAHPLIGVGPGNFDVAYLQYALPGWPQLPGHAHNYYLNLLAETGLLGLGAYLLFLMTLLVVAYRGAQRVRRVHDERKGADQFPLLYGVSLGALGLVTVLTVHHMFDNLYVHGITALVGLVVGLALAAAEMAYRGGAEQG